MTISFLFCFKISVRDSAFGKHKVHGLRNRYGKRSSLQIPYFDNVSPYGLKGRNRRLGSTVLEQKDTFTKTNICKRDWARDSGTVCVRETGRLFRCCGLVAFNNTIEAKSGDFLTRNSILSKERKNLKKIYNEFLHFKENLFFFC